jgi:Carboxypeptidase regulatory-like domain/TonB dependent receptor
MKIKKSTFDLRKSFTIFFLISFLIGFSHEQIYAQAGQGELIVEVRDANDATIGNVQLTLTEISTTRRIEVQADAVGGYIFTNLRPGLYKIEASARGFNTYIREGITVTTGERVRVALPLPIAGLQQVVTVNADAPLLRSETSSLGQVIDNKKVIDLPLNGRSFLSLVGLAPGVAQPPRTSEGASLPRINGGRPRTNEYLFDGISVLQPEPGQVAFFPIVDAIQEFKVEINNPPAEFGRFNGGVVNLSTKAGTNDFHGSVFEFFRNEVLNARNLFAPVGQNKPVFRRNQFGGVIGGPIIKDKTFFFADYQGTRQLVGRIRTSNVPTLANRAGNFSSSLGALLYRTASGAVTTTAIGNTPILVTDTNGNQIQARQNQIFRPSDKLAYAGNIIPAADLDASALRLLQRYPLPTSAGAANNYTRVANEEQNQNQFDVRIDHRFGDSSTVFGRYSFAKDFSNPVTPLPDGSGAIASGAIGTTDTRADSVALNYVKVFSGGYVNEARFGYTRRDVARRSASAVGDNTDLLRGIPQTAAFRDSLPMISIAGFQQLGSNTNTNTDFTTDVTEFFDAVSFQRGKHSFKFGADYRRQRLNVLQPPSPTGQFTFNQVLTNSNGAAGAPTGLATLTGNAFASFLLGQVQNFTIDLQPEILRPRAQFLELFAQDDFRLSSRLTLNLGVRYTLNFPSTEADNRSAVFNLDTRQLDYAGQNGVSEPSRQLHKNNFGPRVGLAYRYDDKTVFRTGYGVVFIEQAGITTPFTTPFFPFVQTVTQRSLDNRNAAFVLSGATRPNVSPVAFDGNAGLGQSVFGVDRGLGSGYVQQWNIGIQRQLTRNIAFEIAYAGSKITHVGIPDVNINQLTASQLALGAQLQTQVANPCFGIVPRDRSNLGDPTVSLAQTLKPFPCYNTVSLYRNNVGNTNYNALQTKIEQRLSDNFSFLVAYTRSKLIDEASSVFDATIQTGPIANFPVADSFNRKLERDLSTGDIPNVFVASFTYDFNFFRNAKGFAGKLLKGWSANGIVNSQSGIPIAVTQATNFNAFAGFGTQRPNLVADPNLASDQRSTAAWFNVAAFQTAPQFTIGTASRNPVRGPGYHNFDLVILKRTNLTETTDIEFRTEIFNLTNTPPLGNPAVVLGAAGFGSITSAGDPRIVQFGLKLHF